MIFFQFQALLEKQQAAQVERRKTIDDLSSQVRSFHLVQRPSHIATVDPALLRPLVQHTVNEMMETKIIPTIHRMRLQFEHDLNKADESIRAELSQKLSPITRQAEWVQGQASRLNPPTQYYR